MVALQLQERTLSEQINKIATHEGKSANDILEEAVRYYLDVYREKRIRAESKAWYELPIEVRNQYKGFVVAVYNGKIVDRDSDRRVLYLRVKERFNREPVLLVEGGEQTIPAYTNYSAKSL